MYRDRSLVDGMAHATRHEYRALKIYGHPRHRHAIGTPTELHRALEDGRLTAWGMRSGGGDRVEEIPAFEWPALRIAPPLVHPTPGASMDEPWTRVRVESAAVRKLWRSVTETAGRSKFDWEVIRLIHDEVRSANPDFSDNALINEIQLAFEARFNKPAPGRSSIQP